MQDVRGIDEEVGARLVGVRGDLAAELLEFPLRGLPGEVGVGLCETKACKAIESCRSGECLREEQHVAVALFDLGDQPLPEVRWLGVRVVDPKDLDAQLVPREHHLEYRTVDAVAIVVEVQWVDVLVLLRRILGVGDRAVRQGGEPVGMLGRPRMVGGGLQGQIECDLHAEFACAREEILEVLLRAELWVDRVVTTLRRPDRPRRSDVVRRRDQRVVGPLAVDLADRVDWRQVDHIESHVGDAREILSRGQERAVHGVAVVVPAARRSREHLVPRSVERATSVGPNPQITTLGHEFTHGMCVEKVDDLVGQRNSHAILDASAPRAK